jgi:hypothetical protein
MFHAEERSRRRMIGIRHALSVIRVTSVTRGQLNEIPVCGYSKLVNACDWQVAQRALSFRSIHSTAWEGAIAQE